jgi:hypothetical protein
MYGSLVNRIQETSGQKDWSDVEVGEGVTCYLWSDRDAYTVVGKPSKGVLRVTQDDAQRTDSNGLSEHQEYSFTTDWDSEGVLIKKNRKGQWVEIRLNPETGRYNNVGGYKYSVGHRCRYRDPSF